MKNSNSVNNISIGWMLDNFLLESYWAQSLPNNSMSYATIHLLLGEQLEEYCKLYRAVPAGKKEALYNTALFSADDKGIYLSTNDRLMQAKCREFLLSHMLMLYLPESTKYNKDTTSFVGQFVTQQAYSDNELQFINKSIDKLMSTPIIRADFTSIEFQLGTTINSLLQLMVTPYVAYDMRKLLNDLAHGSIEVGESLNSYFTDEARAIKLFNYMQTIPFPSFAKVDNGNIILTDDCRAHQEIPLYYLLFFIVKDFYLTDAKYLILYSNYYHLLKDKFPDIIK